MVCRPNIENRIARKCGTVGFVSMESDMRSWLGRTRIKNYRGYEILIAFLNLLWATEPTL